jgi:hypothetical protein
MADLPQKVFGDLQEPMAAVDMFTSKKYLFI